MKITYFLVLTASVSASSVYAEQPLPPVLDNSTYRGALYEPAQAVGAAIPTLPSVSAPALLPVPILPPVSPLPGLPVEGMNKLQNDVSQLKNKVEEQGQVLRALKQQQDAINAKVEQRLSNLNSGVNATIGAVGAHLAAPPVLPKIGVGFESTPGIAAPVTVNEKTRYQNAYTLFRSGKIDQAIAEFQGVIASYPQGEFADNSQYWIGEALLKKGDKNRALIAFDQVVRNHPGSAKVPDAILKLGITQVSLNNKIKAKEYFDFLITNYPGTPSATIAVTRKAKAGLH